LYIQSDEADMKLTRRKIAAPRRPKPTWDADLRELRVGHQVIKRFRQPAGNQVAVLACFEEQRWPLRINDPLADNSDMEPKRRLRDTVFALNRKHRAPKVLLFEADGTGTGIIWRWRR
jgi:hypothetical protein